jgi:hypothetical protein
MDSKISDTLQKYYDQIFQDGKLVNIHISMWGMCHSLSEEDIKIDKALPEVIQLGKKMLIKPAVSNMFKNLQGKARNYLYANSFAFPLVSQAHFVPKGSYLKVYEALNDYRREFMALKEAFLENYENYKQEALDYYREFADQLNVESLAGLYPAKEAVAEKFSFEIVSFEIKLPTEFGNTDIHREVALETAAKQAKASAAASYNAEYTERLDTHMSKVNQFVNDVIGTIRSKVVEHCSLVLKKIGKNEVVTDKSISLLLGQINDFRKMNFVGDNVIETELNKIEQLLHKGPDFSKDKDAVQELKTNLSGLIDEAKNITDVASLSGQYFRKLSI